MICSHLQVVKPACGGRRNATRRGRADQAVSKIRQPTGLVILPNDFSIERLMLVQACCLWGQWHVVRDFRLTASRVDGRCVLPAPCGKPPSTPQKLGDGAASLVVAKCRPSRDRRLSRLPDGSKSEV